MLRPRFCLWFILAIALAVRLLGAVALQNHLGGWSSDRFLISGDAEGYWELSTAIVNGSEFAITNPPLRVMRTPGFPIIISLPMFVFGENHFAVRLFLAFLGAVACGFVFLIGRRLFDERTGIVATGFAAVSPLFVGFSVVLLSETAFTLFLLLSMYLFLRLIQSCREGRRGWRQLMLALITGLSMGWTTLIRPGWIGGAILCGLTMLILVPNKKQAVLAAVLLSLGTVMVLTPWACRNFRVTGHWVWLSLWSGPSLYDGLGPQANGSSDMQFFKEENTLAIMSEYEMDQHYKQRAWEVAFQNPRRLFDLALIKLGRFWKMWPSAPQLQRPLIHLGMAAYSIPFFAAVLIGLWRNRNSLLIWTMLVMPVAWFSFVHSIFVGSIRYRMPGEFFLTILAAVGILCCWDWIRCRGKGDDAEKIPVST